MRCIIIGAGVSGLLMIHKIREAFGNDIDIKVFEKNADVGGTWLENKYPGCACDVPSHIYQYSFAPNPYWSKLFAPSSEIQHYLRAFTKHYDLRRYIRFSTIVSSAEWCEDRSIWRVQTEGGHWYECEVLFNACGILNNPNMPALPNLNDFVGPIMHTADWDTSVDLRDKRLAVIGAGASAIQLLPAIQQQAAHIDIYIRTPSWITRPIGAKDGTANNKQYSKEEIALFENDSEYSLRERKQIEADLNCYFKVFIRGSDTQLDLQKTLNARMRELIRDQALQEKLIPKFEAGCRRLNPGEPYLEALQQSNVRPVFDPIDTVTSTGIQCDGQVHEVDAIILATGFDTSFRPRFPIIGTNNCNLQDLWQNDPIAYFGLAVSGFPNYMIFLGPNTPIANGSVIGSLEATADYFINILRKMRNENIASFDVLPQAQADFDQHTQMLMKKMVWSGACRSWYKNAAGRISAIWPGSSLHYREVLESRRFEDYTWKHRGNRFTYWDDGFSAVERESVEKQDLSYYILPHPNLPKELFAQAEVDEFQVKRETGASVTIPPFTDPHSLAESKQPLTIIDQDFDFASVMTGTVEAKA